LSTVWDAYLEFISADEATQSELWRKGMKAFQKYPPQNLHVSEKEDRLQDMNKRDLQIAAIGWDAAVNAMCYEDGTPVEIAANSNPYRLQLAELESK